MNLFSRFCHLCLLILQPSWFYAPDQRFSGTSLFAVSTRLLDIRYQLCYLKLWVCREIPLVSLVWTRQLLMKTNKRRIETFYDRAVKQNFLNAHLHTKKFPWGGGPVLLGASSGHNTATTKPEIVSNLLWLDLFFQPSFTAAQYCF